MQQYLLYNSTIQSALQAAKNQSLTSKQLLSILQTQQYASDSTLLALEASTKAQTALSLSEQHVSRQQTLLNDMITATNNSQNLVAQSLYSQILTNRTIEAANTAMTIGSIEKDIFDIEKKLLNLTSLVSSQTLASKKFFQSSNLTSNYQTIMSQSTFMLSIVVNTTNVLYNCTTEVNVARQNANQANIAQSIALQAFIKAARLALCYPNPCLHGGMCKANNDDVSYTCFCSSSYKGKNRF